MSYYVINGVVVYTTEVSTDEAREALSANQ